MNPLESTDWLLLILLPSWFWNSSSEKNSSLTTSNLVLRSEFAKLEFLSELEFQNQLGSTTLPQITTDIKLVTPQHIFRSSILSIRVAIKHNLLQPVATLLIIRQESRLTTDSETLTSTSKGEPAQLACPCGSRLSASVEFSCLVSSMLLLVMACGRSL